MPRLLDPHTPAGSVEAGHIVPEKAASVAFGKGVAVKLPKTYPGSPLLRGSLDIDLLDVAGETTDPTAKLLLNRTTQRHAQCFTYE